MHFEKPDKKSSFSCRVPGEDMAQFILWLESVLKFAEVRMETSLRKICGSDFFLKHTTNL